MPHDNATCKHCKKRIYRARAGSFVGSWYHSDSRRHDCVDLGPGKRLTDFELSISLDFATPEDPAEVERGSDANTA